MRSMMEYKTKEHYAKGMLKHMGQKCIVFANTQAQADRICPHSYHSKNSNSDYNLELFSDGRFWVAGLTEILKFCSGISTISDAFIEVGGVT